VVTFRVRPADGGEVRGFRAGQYVSVGVTLPDGARQIRQYSLSGAPGESVRQFSVKRVHGDGTAPDGEVSQHLHARVHEGDVLELSGPYGDLILGDTTGRPLLLASAGIGAPPMVAMLAALAADGHRTPVTVVLGDHSPSDHALRADHTAYAAKLPESAVHFFCERDAHPGSHPGRVHLDRSDVPVRPDTRAYLCGPLPFMRALRAQLIEKGVAPADIHYEVFAPGPVARAGLTEPRQSPCGRCEIPSTSGPVGSRTMSATVTGSRVAKKASWARRRAPRR
jgi:nitric oxide dioxygenase